MIDFFNIYICSDYKLSSIGLMALASWLGFLALGVITHVQTPSSAFTVLYTSTKKLCVQFSQHFLPTYLV